MSLWKEAVCQSFFWCVGKDILYLVPVRTLCKILSSLIQRRVNYILSEIMKIHYILQTREDASDSEEDIPDPVDYPFWSWVGWSTFWKQQEMQMSPQTPEHNTLPLLMQSLSLDISTHQRQMPIPNLGSSDPKYGIGPIPNLGSIDPLRDPLAREGMSSFQFENDR